MGTCHQILMQLLAVPLPTSGPKTSTYLTIVGNERKSAVIDNECGKETVLVSTSQIDQFLVKYQKIII